MSGVRESHNVSKEVERSVLDAFFTVVERESRTRLRLSATRSIYTEA